MPDRCRPLQRLMTGGMSPRQPWNSSVSMVQPAACCSVHRCRRDCRRKAAVGEPTAETDCQLSLFGIQMLGALPSGLHLLMDNVPFRTRPMLQLDATIPMLESATLGYWPT
jgi:hypothetical protein